MIQRLSETPAKTARAASEMPHGAPVESGKKFPERGPLAVDKLRGFGPMSRLSTSFGDVYAQALRERDMLRTRAGGFAKIVQVDRIVLDEEFLRYHPEALPIRIAAGAFGRNVPAKDVILAPFQSISGNQALSGRPIARAAEALGRPNIMRLPETIFTYTVIRCDRPVSVLCEGLWLDV